MALPPTGLSKYILTDGLKMWTTLKEADLLSEKGLENKETFVEFVEKTLKEYYENYKTDLPGPTPENDLEEGLVFNSDFLNEEERKLHDIDERW